MPVTSIGSYKFPPRDSEEIYGDNQLLYFCWDRHLLFAAPFITCVPRTMIFGDWIETTIKPMLVSDPDTVSIDWENVQWFNGPQAINPDFGASLEANNMGHKDKIIMVTPGLNSLIPES